MNQDPAIECVAEGSDAGSSMDAGLGCPSGDICIAGRCHTACAEDLDCGPREECGAEGVCMPNDDPIPDVDAGPPPPDTGPPDPCAEVTCEGLEVCLPRTGTCHACNEESINAPAGSPGRCAGLSPICDIANGECVTAMPRACGACTVDADCVDLTGGFTGTCVRLIHDTIAERVCLPACGPGEDCPAGMECNSGMGVCTPQPFGVSCTTWRRGTDATTCFDDLECSILGTNDPFVGACDGVGSLVPDAGPFDGGPDAGPFDAGPPLDAGPPPDAGPRVSGTCRQPCGVAEHCADATFECDGTSGRTFCVPPSGT